MLKVVRDYWNNHTRTFFHLLLTITKHCTKPWIAEFRSRTIKHNHLWRKQSFYGKISGNGFVLTASIKNNNVKLTVRCFWSLIVFTRINMKKRRTHSAITVQTKLIINPLINILFNLGPRENQRDSVSFKQILIIRASLRCQARYMHWNFNSIVSLIPRAF